MHTKGIRNGQRCVAAVNLFSGGEGFIDPFQKHIIFLSSNQVNKMVGVHKFLFAAEISVLNECLYFYLSISQVMQLENSAIEW